MQTQRATNLELKKWIAQQHGFMVESAWIDRSRNELAGSESEDGRGGHEETPIPAEKLIAIRQALRHFGMLS